MRTGAAAGHVGYFHEAATYASADGLLQLVLPHLQGALDAGEPALASLPDAEASLVRDAMGGAHGVTFLPVLGPAARPAEVLKRTRSLFATLAAGGIEQVRVVSTIPHPGIGATWDGWCRFEAAVNHLFEDISLWALCLYDRRITSPAVLDDVERTHPRLVNADGHHVLNHRYQDPRAFILSMSPSPIDPLEHEPAAMELVDPSPAQGRHAVRDLAGRTHLTPDEVDDLVVATSEVLTNAIKYGRPPVTVRLWAAAQRMVVTVKDRGPGPIDPFVGLVPEHRARDEDGGLGLWLVHQLLAVGYSHDPDGFTVHLLAGRPVTSDGDHRARPGRGRR